MRDVGINYAGQVSQSSLQCFLYETIQPQIAHLLVATLRKYFQLLIILLQSLCFLSCLRYGLLNDREGGIRVSLALASITDLSFSFL